MSAEVGVVYDTPNDRLWLPRLRQWIASNSSFLDRLGVRPVVTPRLSPADAVAWRAESPELRLLIAIGYSRRGIGGGQKLANGEPIIVHDPAATGADSAITSSVFCSSPVVACSDVMAQLRKSLIRIALRQKRVAIRAPGSDAELSSYFALRYKVWKAQGYLRDENARTRTEWEIDFWDRTAVPLCAFGPDGRVLGCLRLIGSFGDEEPSYVRKIERLLAQKNDPALSQLFRFEHRPMQPFDVLFEFPGFRAKFRELMRSRASVAEIGRVAVDADCRGQCLAEILVDSAISQAQLKGVACLLLACRNELGSLYARSGFEPVAGLQSEKFFNIRMPSIVMERQVRQAELVT